MAVNRSSCFSFWITVIPFPLFESASVWVLLSRSCLFGENWVWGEWWVSIRSNFLFGARFLFLILVSKIFLFALFLVIAINCVLLNEFKLCLVRCDLFLAVFRQKTCCSFRVFFLPCMTSCSNCFLAAAWLWLPVGFAIPLGFSVCFNQACFISWIVSMAKFSTSFVVNFIKWCMHPMNDLSCFSVFGISSLFIESHFRFVGVIPVGVIWYPSQVISFFANSHFCSFIARFSLSNWYNILSISFSWPDMFPFVMINMSSRKANLLRQFWIRTSIFLEGCRHVC